MARPRAGHSWTWIDVGEKNIHLIQDEAGRWLTTGQARGWPRCARCRRPERCMPFGGDVCPTCYFYKTGMPVDEFWRLHKSGYQLAPYNIGRACMKNHEILHQINLEPKRWRSILRTQFQ